MKGVFVVFAAIVACALARNEILNYICSASATGVATIVGIGDVPCRMARVRSTVRYDFLGGNGAVIGSYIIRPELNYYFLYLPSLLPAKCIYSYSYVTLDSYYVWDVSEDVVHFACSGFDMYFNGTTLTEERLSVEGYDITIKYNTVNNNFEHNEVDDFFSLDNENCSAASSKATQAITWRFCTDAEVPDYMCSVSGNGVGVLSSSSGDVPVDVTMYRVKNSVRFDLIDKVYQIPYATFLQRGDQYDSYFYKSSDQSCSALGFSNYPSREYIETTEDRLDVFGYSSYRWWFNHDTHEFVKESIEFYPYTLTINYTSVNHDYARETNDNTFSLNYDSCPDDAEEKAPHLLTSLQCSPKKVITPKVPSDCSFEVTVKMIDEERYFYYYYGSDEINVKVVMKDNEIYGFNAVFGNSSVLLRCDIKDKRGRGKCLNIAHYVTGFDYYSYMYGYYGYETCYDDEFERPDEMEMYVPIFDFEYTGEPEDVKCPDGSSGCKKYCDYSEGRGSGDCRVFNKEGQIVQVDEEYVLEYKNADVSSLDLQGRLCNGGILKAPDYSCSGNGSLFSFSSATFTIPSIVLFIVAFLFVLF